MKPAMKEIVTQRLMSEHILLGGEIMTRRQAVDMLSKEGCSPQCIDITVFGPRAVAVELSDGDEEQKKES